jgi:asparagine synthetase B (glutamine-hydrolysing)
VTLPEPARDLLALPPSRFVSERNALAKALSARGDAAASAVRALRRPVGLAWVMNRLARDRPEDVAALLAAGDRLRRGQRRALSGEGAEELRAGEAELRGTARALRDAAAPLLGGKGSAGLSRLELLLRIAASTPAAREALRAGVLEREPEAEAVDLSGLAVLEGGGSGGSARRAKRGARAAGQEEARERAGRRAHDAALRAARATLARADAAARRAEADAARAEAAARRAQEAASRAATRAEALRRRAEAARAEARERERSVGDLAGKDAAPARRR